LELIEVGGCATNQLVAKTRAEVDWYWWWRPILHKVQEHPSPSLRVISIRGGESQRGSVTVRMILLMRVGISGGEQPEEK